MNIPAFHHVPAQKEIFASPPIQVRKKHQIKMNLNRAKEEIFLGSWGVFVRIKYLGLNY